MIETTERKLLIKHNLEALIADSLLVVSESTFPKNLRKAELENARILIQYVEEQEGQELSTYRKIVASYRI